MKTTFLGIKQSLNKAYLKEKLSRTKLDEFKQNLAQLLERIDEQESEENIKNDLITFLNDTYCKNNFFHVYNRGDGKDNLFYKPENYQYFIRQYKKYLHYKDDIF